MAPVFVHEVEAALAPGSDERALGAAVTVALCGHWEHEGTCTWRHLTTIASRRGTEIVARIVFECGADEEGAVRARISGALYTGRLEAPDGLAAWRIVVERAPEPSAEERRWEKA
jgi:hypothetical protein